MEKIIILVSVSIKKKIVFAIFDRLLELTKPVFVQVLSSCSGQRTPTISFVSKNISTTRYVFSKEGMGLSLQWGVTNVYNQAFFYFNNFFLFV